MHEYRNEGKDCDQPRPGPLQLLESANAAVAFSCHSLTDICYILFVSDLSASTMPEAAAVNGAASATPNAPAMSARKS